MKKLALVLFMSIPAVVHAQAGPVPTLSTSQTSKVEHRRKVPAVAKPKAILPAQKDLVSTAQSGASRSAKLPTTMPAMSLATPAAATTAATKSETQKGRWVLVYRTANCTPCDRLMNALSSTEGSGTPAAQRVTIVLGQPVPATIVPSAHQGPARTQAAKANQTAASTAAQQNDLNALRSKYPALNNAEWAYDTAGTAAASLKPAGAPMMYGMDGTHIVWQTAGMPGGPAATQQRVASWLASKSSAEIVAAVSAAATSAHP